jgi:type 1 fimbria pilin
MRILTRRFWIDVLVVLAVTMGWSASAHAACSTTVSPPAAFNYGSMAVSNALAVGEVIPGTARQFRLAGTCSGLYNLDIVACPPGGTQAVSGMTGVYQTGLGGVGMRIRTQGGVPLVGTGVCATTSSLGKTSATGAYDVSGSFELVKTGAVTTGAMTAASYSLGVLNTGVGTGSISVSSGTQLRTVTCSISTDSANQTVILPTVTVRSLASAGKTAGVTPFQLALSCAPGVRVNMTLMSVASDSGVNSVLGSTGTSSGVGIQILDSTYRALTLNEIHKLIDSTTGDATIHFFAQYYRLSSVLKPGPVSAAAIVTMSYE